MYVAALPQHALGLDLCEYKNWWTHEIMQDAGLTGRGWLFGRPDCFQKNAPKNMRRCHVVAPAALEPPKG